MGDKAYCTFRSSSGRCGPSDIIELRGKWGYKSPVYPILIRSVEDCLVSGGDALLPHSGDYSTGPPSRRFGPAYLSTLSTTLLRSPLTPLVSARYP